jgi:hypothetical protein
MTTPLSSSPTLPVDWRALCKALMDAIDDGIPAERIKQSPMAVLYDAAMAQPEPEAPTDQELLRLYQVATPCHAEKEYKRELDFARAVLARWGH